MEQANLPDWQLENGHLKRTFSFVNYADGVAFVVKVALLAEKMNHHPDIELGYKKVTISYFTHDANGLSDKDFAAAAQVDKL